MKFITFLFTVFFWFNAVAVAPYGFKGQKQSSVLYSNVLQGQNNLVTNMGGINALLETGNKNILTNPSFEHATFSTGWTNSAGTFTQDTIVEIDGLKAASLVLSSQAMSVTQDSTLYQAQFADGVQGLASIRVKTSVSGIKVCSRQAGVSVQSLCVDVVANNKWGLYKVPFILGGTSNGISINSNGTSVTGTVYLDDAFVGAVDLVADVDQSRMAGESYFAGTAGCTWTRTSSTLGAFSTTAACPGPTVAYSSMGQWQTTDADLPKQTINNLPPGVYKATFTAVTSQNTGGVPAYSINDGTTTCEAVGAESSISNSSSVVVSCTFIYNSSGNRSFELYSGSTTNTVSLYNGNTAPRASVKFQLEYFGSGSVYSSTNADTDWQSCGHTTSSFTGFGTVTAIETQCKRQGSDLLMRGKFTTGTVTATEARVSLPVWNGAQLTSAGTSKIQSLQIIGSSARSNVGAANTIFAAIQPSVSYSVFTAIGSPAGTTTLLGTSFGSSETQTMQTLRIPIEGWQNSNILIGQFNGLESCTSTLECTDVFSAYGTNAGVISQENVDFINGNGTVASGVFTYTFKSGVFTVAPNCVVNVGPFGASVGNYLTTINSISSSGISFNAVFNGAASAFAHQIICQKQGVDYIGKTAKAVASDQNLRSPGLTRAVVNSCLWTSAGAFNNPVMCNAGFSSMSKPATGRYQLNFARTQANDPVCIANNTNVGADRMCNIYSISTSSVTVQCENSSAGTDLDVPGLVICHGVE